MWEGFSFQRRRREEKIMVEMKMKIERGWKKNRYGDNLENRGMASV